jgi:hypothetical protein
MVVLVVMAVAQVLVETKAVQVQQQLVLVHTQVLALLEEAVLEQVLLYQFLHQAVVVLVEQEQLETLPT